MASLRFALLGTGFWSYYQLAGWLELQGAECVALYNRTPAKAEALAQRLGLQATVYDSVETLLDTEKLDFVDICTNVETHAPLTRLAAGRGLNVVCQKPMATTLAEAREMVQTCRDAGVKLLINENWRWQHQIRALRVALDRGNIGKPFRARVHYCNSFPVFDNQPFLKELEQFILTDIGSHILDTTRYLFGDARSLYAQTYRVHPDIKGEDVATVLLDMANGMTVTCEMSYASRTEIEAFPQTYVYIEGDQGFLELAPGFTLRETTAAGTHITRHVPRHYAWADPAYDLVHTSIVDCQADLLRGLQGHSVAETNGDDNLKTMELVFGSYESAATRQTITL
jgi:D-apiose dehydrogenase